MLFLPAAFAVQPQLIEFRSIKKVGVSSRVKVKSGMLGACLSRTF